MEKMLVSLLKKQGFEYIGIFDTEKNIWGYVKDGKFHFCHDNLVEVDRSAIGDNIDVLVISKTEDKLSIVEHKQEISNYVVIDSQNNILAKKTEDDYRKKCCLRINSKSVLLKEKNKNDYLSENGCSLYKRYHENVKPQNQIVIINEVIEPQIGLWKIYGNVYILVSNSETMIHNGKRLVKLGWFPPIWKHEDGTIHCLSIIEQENKLEYTTITKGYIETNTIDLHLSEKQSIDSLEFYSDNYIIVTLYNGKNRDWEIIGDSVLIISYDTSNIHSYPIQFSHNGKMPVAFTNDILIREKTYKDFDDDGYDCEITDNIELYDIRGNQLELQYNTVSELNGYNPLYVPFSIRSNGIFNNINKLYGVVRLGKQWAKVVIPPIFEKIEEISYELYKVQFGNYVGDNYHRFEGLYSITDGFIHAEANQLQYSNKIEGVNIYTKVPEDIIVFTKKGKKGLIYNGEIVIDACLDDICGFEFSDKYVGEKKEWTPDEIKEKTKEYTPKCVILKNEGKYGLFINKNNIIMPIYDSIRCILITGENARYNEDSKSFDYDKRAYFEVKKGNKVGVISDNPKFNEISKVEYEKIEVIEKYRHAAYFKVYKDCKIGLLSSKNVGRKLFSLLAKYDYLDIILLGFDKFLYEGDGIYYNENEKKIMESEHHSYLGFCHEINCIAFKNKESEDYIFLDYFDAKQLKEKGYDKDGNIILSYRCTFNISEEKFIVQEGDSYDENDYHDECIDDYDYERDTYYALGGDDYDRFREEGGSIDAMMDGMGL